MSWMINDTEADRVTRYLERLYKLEPSADLRNLIRSFRNSTENNRGRSL